MRFESIFIKEVTNYYTGWRLYGSENIGWLFVAVVVAVVEVPIIQHYVHATKPHKQSQSARLYGD